MASKISVVINAQDVESDLPRALASVKQLADEIVVIDQESSDGTYEIAKNAGARLFKHKKVDYVELARNYAISKATNSWILLLDADEEVPSSLVAEIKNKIKYPKADYYRIPRKNIIFGKWIKNSRWWPDMNIRLFKKGYVSWNEVIHAVPMTKGVGEDFEAKEDVALVHHNYSTIEEYLGRMSRYTTQYASMKAKEGYKFAWKDLITKPSSEFLSRYFYGEGYKDGVHGLALSLLQAFSELVVYLKIWEYDKFFDNNPRLDEVTDLLKDEERNLHYWENDASYKETGSLANRIRRKLKI